MKISELARAAGTPLATVKYYLREGLLDPGVRTSATTASYDDSHLARLHLIRALGDVGGLSLAQIRLVLDALSGTDPYAAVGSAHEALCSAPTSPSARHAGRALVEELGWRVHPQSAALRELDAAIDAAVDVGVAFEGETARVYAEAARQIAVADIASLPSDPQDAVTAAVLGTVLLEPVLVALRRVAQQSEADRSWRDLFPEGCEVPDDARAGGAACLMVSSEPPGTGERGFGVREGVE